jgi:hypothetical protein
MSLTLPLDAGAMLQLAVLISEEVGYHGIWRGLRGLVSSKGSSGVAKRPSVAYEVIGKDEITLQTIQASISRSDEETLRNKERPLPEDIGTKAVIAIAALLLFLIIVALQIVGVVHASKGRNDSDGLTVSWCSPIFELLTMAVSTGDCELYPVEQNSGKGVGCIRLPAEQQIQWLKTVVIIGSVQLIFEAFDFLILALVHGKTRWRQVKMQRPWFSVRNLSLRTISSLTWRARCSAALHVSWCSPRLDITLQTAYHKELRRRCTFS